VSQVEVELLAEELAASQRLLPGTDPGELVAGGVALLVGGDVPDRLPPPGPDGSELASACVFAAVHAAKLATLRFDRAAARRKAATTRQADQAVAAAERDIVDRLAVAERERDRLVAEVAALEAAARARGLDLTKAGAGLGEPPGLRRRAVDQPTRLSPLPPPDPSRLRRLGRRLGLLPPRS
jgi:hypothetical protein